MTDDLVKRLNYQAGPWHSDARTLYKEAAARIEKLEKALDQLLDDMGKDGLCVCQAAKDQAIEALGETNDR